MQDLSALFNSPVEFPLAGRKVRVRQVEFRNLYPALVAMEKSRRIAEAHRIMSEMGLAGKDRQDFLATLMRELSGPGIEDDAWRNFGTNSFVVSMIVQAAAGLGNAPEVMEAELYGIIQNDGVSPLMPIVRYACGIPEPKAVEAGPGLAAPAPDDEAAKKKTGLPS